MKDTKKFLAAVSVLLFAAGTVYAQEKTDAKETKKQEVKAVLNEQKDRLGLKPEQQVPFRSVIKKYAVMMKDLQGSSLTSSEKAQKMNEINSQRDAEMKSFLSAEQYKTYIEMQEERRAKFIDMRKTRSPFSNTKQ